ncbi:glycosyltransferase family protein [Geomesophilobacter sediminis]|uniref:Glycosyltransferase n=1 Tax=Geomesophilobacter sediminis TaxID=2798584 RepID=A0A8J7S7N1_9BACT|nr:glycosyltransferase [Geomesophilobacter sediminis]MBJ6727027.1 glycosyltransferase [Geomesophilobacter sediminis]
MTKPTVHFVYATPYSKVDQYQLKLLGRKLWHQSWDRYRWPAPVQAPLSITYHVARRLSERFPVKLYNLHERIDLRPEDGDILLGHPVNDCDSVVWRALADNRFHRKYLIAPYNHDPRQVGWLAEAVEQCDKFFAICGNYWIDTLDRSPLLGLRDKLVHLNMALDPADYPLLKTTFNPPGKRKFFYIGRLGTEKGVDLLEGFAASGRGFSGGFICSGGDIKGWKRISVPRKLTPDFMAAVAREYDIFINMSRADAQATTILEAMSWGFPVACTRESGYTKEDFTYLDLDDAEGNLKRLEALQELPESELKCMSEGNRNRLQERYGWNNFLNILEENL